MSSSSGAGGDPTPAFSCLYFGFASNLSPRTLAQRCPGSLYIGLGILRGWKFIVSEVGFGNIVRSSGGEAANAANDDDDVVYGNLYFLTAQHEAALDKSEEVPEWHQKVMLEVEMVPPADNSGGGGGGEETWQAGQKVTATCYIDTRSAGQREGLVSKEYVIWLRKAVADGVKSGVPEGYFERYFDRFLPEDASVGREEEVVMIRTVETNREDLRYVPRELLQGEER